MNKRWLLIGGGVILAGLVIVFVPGGCAVVYGAARKIREKRLDAKVAKQERNLRLVAGC